MKPLIDMEIIKTSKVHQILQKAFKAKLQRNPSYSQRALARDLGTSSVFVNNILTGKKNLPATRFKRVFKVLDMDITSQTELMRAAIVEALPSSDLRTMAKVSFTKPATMEKYVKQSMTQFTILKNWYAIGILNYFCCEDLNPSIEAIGSYFGVHVNDVRNTIDGLQSMGLIKYENDRYVKSDVHSYFPTTKTQAEVRDFHRQMIHKSLQELNRTKPDDFEKRLISGFTIAANPEKIDLAKKMISEFLGEISELLTEGKASDVYQCNIQLFPLKADIGEKK